MPGYLVYSVQYQYSSQQKTCTMICNHEYKLLYARIEEQERAMDNFSREIVKIPASC
jgi:hypothetical protein